MKTQFVIIIIIGSLFSFCSKPEKIYHQGLTKIWQNKSLRWNASSLIIYNDQLYGTTLDKSIFKVDVLTGKTIWKSESSTSYEGQKPLITNKRIFIGGSDVLNSYDLSGKLQWSIKTNTKIGHTIINNDSLIFGSLTNNGLAAYNKSNGALKWQIEPDYQMLSSSKPAIHDSLLVISDFDYSLSKNFKHTKLINANNGEVIWSKKRKKYLTGEAVFNKENLYICFDSAYVKGMVSALDLKSGSTIWEINSNPQIHIKPHIIQNSILIASYERGLDCLDIMTGKLNWTLNSKEFAPGTELIVFSDLIFFGTQQRKLVGVSEQGEVQFQSSFEYGIGNPLKYQNSLYIPDGNGNMFKLDSMP